MLLLSVHYWSSISLNLPFAVILQGRIRLTTHLTAFLSTNTNRSWAVSIMTVRTGWLRSELWRGNSQFRAALTVSISLIINCYKYLNVGLICPLVFFVLRRRESKSIFVKSPLDAAALVIGEDTFLLPGEAHVSRRGRFYDCGPGPSRSRSWGKIIIFVISSLLKLFLMSQCALLQNVFIVVAKSEHVHGGLCLLLVCKDFGTRRQRRHWSCLLLFLLRVEEVLSTVCAIMTFPSFRWLLLALWLLWRGVFKQSVISIELFFVHLFFRRNYFLFWLTLKTIL